MERHQCRALLGGHIGQLGGQRSVEQESFVPSFYFRQRRPLPALTVLLFTLNPQHTFQTHNDVSELTPVGPAVDASGTGLLQTRLCHTLRGLLQSGLCHTLPGLLRQARVILCPVYFVRPVSYSARFTSDRPVSYSARFTSVRPVSYSARFTSDRPVSYSAHIYIYVCVCRSMTPPRRKTDAALSATSPVIVIDFRCKIIYRPVKVRTMKEKVDCQRQ